MTRTLKCRNRLNKTSNQQTLLTEVNVFTLERRPAIEEGDNGEADDHKPCRLHH